MHFCTNVPILELDYATSAIDIGISHSTMYSQAPEKEHLIKIGILARILEL
jgi:hypothetical protein